MGLFVFDFGQKKGVQTYRVNGTKEELEEILLALEKEEAPFKNGSAPIIEHVHRSLYTLLLEIIIDKERAVMNGLFAKNSSTNEPNISR